MRSTLRLLTLLATSLALLAAPSVVRAEPAVAMNGGSQLYFFDTSNPAVNTTRAIAGMDGNPVVAMDLRPANGDLYAFTAADPAGADNTMLQLHRIDLATAVATNVGAPIGPFVDSGFWGMDFNPVADRIRLTEGGSSEKNYRVVPDSGTLITDTNLTGATDVADTAYDRNISTATATTAFAVDGTTDKLYRLGGVDGSPSPNSGLLTEVGPLGVDLTKDMRFDISPTSGTAYVSHFFALYTVNLQTGALSGPAMMPFNPSNGIAFLGSSSVALDAASASVSEEAGSLAVTVTRSGVTNRATSVTWATSSATATPSDRDYTAAGGTINFAKGETSHTVFVPILRDAVNDPNETFTVQLGAVTNGELGAVTTQTVTITQETTKPTVFVAPLLPRTYALLAKLGLAARFSVSEASTTTVRLKLGTKVVGTGVALTTTGPSIRTAKATLTPRGKVLVAAALRASRLGRVPLTLTLTTTDTAGNVRTTSARIVVRR
jgi:hypothetical protein